MPRQRHILLPKSTDAFKSVRIAPTVFHTPANIAGIHNVLDMHSSFSTGVHWKSEKTDVLVLQGNRAKACWSKTMQATR